MKQTFYRVLFNGNVVGSWMLLYDALLFAKALLLEYESELKLAVKIEKIDEGCEVTK